jgi:hypothetical protein
MMKSRVRSGIALGPLVLAITLMLPATSGADKFYTSDVVFDGFVEIDTDSGTAIHLGSALYPVNGAGGTGVAVEYFGTDILWTHFSFDGFPLRIHRWNPESLAFQGFVDYKQNGEIVSGAIGGMSWDGSKLLVTIGDPTIRAPRLADLSLAGEISNVTDFSPHGVTSFDCLAISPGGEILAVEDLRDEAVPTANFYRLARPATLERRGVIPHSPNDPIHVRYMGMDFTDSGDLWLLERTGAWAWVMRRIDPTTGQVLEDVEIDYLQDPRSVALIGLAFVTEEPVQIRSTSWGHLKGIYR